MIATFSTVKNQSTWGQPTPPENVKCQICGICIFDSQAEAKASQVPYVIAVNHAIGELCIGCAGGDQDLDRLLTLVERIEAGEPPIEREEIHMSENNGLFLKMETGVMPPAAGPSGSGQSKYVPLERAILDLSIGRAPANGLGLSLLSLSWPPTPTLG